MEINYNDDIWEIPCQDKSLARYHTFDFSNIKPETLKKQFKDYFFNSLKHENIKISTLHRYCYSIHRFIDFVDEADLNIKYFNDLTGNIIDKFIIYLKSICKSSSTMIISFTALKESVKYGQNLGLDKYPKKEIFPMEISRIFSQEDTIKTRLFSDEVGSQITKALISEKNIYLKTVVMIAYETGLRLSEILNLKVNCIINDFGNQPLIFISKDKVDEERCVPISDECVKQIKELQEYTKDFRNKDNNLFSIRKSKQGYTIFTQKQARYYLKLFLNNNNIKDESGNIAYVIFHGFRHNVGTAYLNSGASADETRISLGHKSLHSTNLYSKMKPKNLYEKYKKIGFIGIDDDDLIENTEQGNKIVEKQKLIEGALPDGVCLQAFEGDTHCDKFNVCLFCNKYRTTVEDLATHKQHLERLKADKERYMAEMSIGNIEYLEKIQVALETIIERLEAIKNESK